MKLSVHAAAEEAGDELAIIDGPRTMTWRDVANAVRRQTIPSRHPMVLTPSISTDSVVAVYAALASGTGIVLRHSSRRQPKQVALGSIPSGSVAIETSGTGGASKLIVHQRDALVAHAEASAHALGSEVDDRWLVCLPLAHVSGLAPIIRALVQRRAVILEPRWSARAVADSIASNRATLISLVPTMLHDLMEIGWQPGKAMRHVLVGGARCPAALIDRARDRNIPISSVYGMTETFSHVLVDGLPLAGVETRIDSDGTLAIRAASSTAWPKWHKTGDLVRREPSGRLEIIGRLDAVIISGGENVFPTTVEDALVALPSISEAVVVGIDDARWGQLVVAAVVVASADFDLEATDHELKKTLAAFERPRRYLAIEAIPRLPSGKPDRVAVADLFS